MSKEKISVMKSPVVPMPDFGEETIIYSNQVVYYVQLPSGILVTKPEDFPIAEEEIVEED